MLVLPSLTLIIASYSVPTTALAVLKVTAPVAGFTPRPGALTKALPPKSACVASE